MFFSPASMHTVAIGMPTGYEWIIVLVIALLIFGKRLPGMAKSIGQGIKEFKRGVKDADSAPEDDASKQIAEEPAKEARKPRFDPETGKPLDPAAN